MNSELMAGSSKFYMYEIKWWTASGICFFTLHCFSVLRHFREEAAATAQAVAIVIIPTVVFEIGPQSRGIM